MDPIKGDNLPEVGEVVKGESGIHEIGWFAVVSVGQETRLHLLDIDNAPLLELIVEPTLHSG